MSYVILVFAIMMLVTGIIILVKPMAVFSLVNNHSRSLKLHVFAVLIRLFLGVVLVIFAKGSEFPMTLAILGWLLIGMAIVLAVIGRENFKKLVGWSLNLIPEYGRLIGAFAIVLSGLLAYVAL